MKHGFKSVILALSLMFFTLFCFDVNALAKDNKNKIILIDPGHGGIDGGAVSKSGIVEKDVNLKISKMLKSKLESKGYKVLMTREEDSGLYSDKGKVRDKKNEDLANRCKMKQESKCDVFISIHLNMFEQSKYYGAQVWYEKGEESIKLAHITQENLVKDLNNNNNRKEKCAKGDYKILRNVSDVPSILVECGFLSNVEEANLLATEAYQDKITTSLCNSIVEYFAWIITTE